MLELLLCSMLTILPDFLVRRFVQGKRLGREITLYSVWYELRYGIIACVMLTVTLITVIFYNHPSTTSAAAFFRTVTILPEAGGRVAEIHVASGDRVEALQPLFRLDNSAETAAVATAERKVAEVDAASVAAQSELALAQARLDEAQAAYEQTLDELEARKALIEEGSAAVSRREVERMELTVAGRQASLDAARAGKAAAETTIATVLPAQRASAVAALAQAQTTLDKTVIRAGVAGTLEQFTLRVGDYVNPMLRPAGFLIPEGAGRIGIQAGFGQIEAQVIKTGMIAEVICISKPFTVIPMVVSHVQDFIAAGQVRPGEQLIDPTQVRVPGSLLVYLEPLHPDGLDGVMPGSSCIANAYSSNHEALASGELGFVGRTALHALDATAIVHAMLLRLQALILPVRTLVLSGH